MEALETVKTARHAHALQRPDIKCFISNTHQKVAKVLELAIGFALGHDARNDRLAHVLDAAHAVADFALFVDRKRVFRLVHIGT